MERLSVDVIRKLGTDPSLRLRDIFNLCMTNKRMSETICSSPLFWRLRYRTDFGEDLPKGVMINSAREYGAQIKRSLCGRKSESKCLKDMAINDPEGYLTLRRLFRWKFDFGDNVIQGYTALVYNMIKSTAPENTFAMTDIMSQVLPEMNYRQRKGELEMMLIESLAEEKRKYVRLFTELIRTTKIPEREAQIYILHPDLMKAAIFLKDHDLIKEEITKGHVRDINRDLQRDLLAEGDHKTATLLRPGIMLKRALNRGKEEDVNFKRDLKMLPKRERRWVRCMVAGGRYGTGCGSPYET